ncbi:unnamed protein product [Rotaria sordida]|uniref:ATP-dependent DNA helicase n=1 Tax=Rotaria sordida TaxID=392033 RepID=A0A815LQZ6_9BILA|nr:unnamed protein product [Rotaria sordida]CAF1626169.1 unnamed protein product [Rotaria sordida]
MEYSEHHVPILYGPQIPRRDRDDTRERYSRVLLTLFVPWRTVTDLCGINQTWEDALKSRQNRISIRSWEIIENIQLLHECKKDRDEHLLQIIAEAQTDNDAIDPILLPANQDIDGEHDADDSEDLLELLGNIDEYTTAATNATKKPTEDKYIEETIEAVKNVGRFSHINTHHQSSSNESINYVNQQLVPFISATPNLIRLNTKWQEQLKTEKERVRKSLITGNYANADDTLDLHAAKDAVVTVVNPNNYNKNNFENYGSILPVVSVATNFPTQKTIADEFTLNREQRAAFMIITSHLDGDSRCRTGDNNDQLIMCIPGCGGTGKSQLIRALSKYFLVTKRMQMMRKLAPTGIAAAEIGGMTIHSFLGEQRNSGKPRTIKPGDLKLEKEWRLVEYLLIDEMSMVGLNLLAKLNRIICSAKHVDPQVPFGGVNVIFFGDYLQYRPVYDAPLHTDFSLPSKKKSGKLPTEKEIQQRVARSLILQINCVVKLTQQMRTEDPRYLQLLERLRRGQCNYDDYELLLTRVVGQSSVGSLRDSPWNKAPILVFRNEVRTQLNNKAAIHKAAEMGQAPIVCVAQDTCKGKSIEDPTLVKKLLELSDSKTEHLPGLLPLVPGMPVILTQNVAIELGLINGMNGVFRQLVYEEDSVSTEVLSETFPSNTQYIRKPSYALIETVKSKIECNLEQLQTNLVPIPLMEQTFRIDIGDVLPKDKRPKSNRKAILSIKRRALPLVPAYCITTHKSQGQTLNNVVIDLKLPNETDDIAAIYVPLSRVKRLADLVILRHFDYKVLLIKPSCPSQLNIPNPLVTGKYNIENTVKHNLNCELQSSSIPMNSWNNCDTSLNQNYLTQMMQSLSTAVRKLEQTDAKIESVLLRQEQKIDLILTILQQIVPSHTLDNQSNQQCVQSGPEKHMCNSPLSIGAIEMDCQTQEIFQTVEASTNGNENFMQDNQENYTAPLSYDSAFTAFNCDQISFGFTTNNRLNSNTQSLISFDDIEKSPSTKIQGNIHQTTRCHDSCVRREEQALVPFTTIDQRKTKKKNQLKRNEKSKKNSIDFQSLCHLPPVNEIQVNNHEGSTEICLLHPLKERLSPKTDRITKLKDCFGETPILVVCGDGLPDNISMKLAITSESPTGRYYSVYQFSQKSGEDKSIIDRSIKKYWNKTNMLELKNLKVHKRCDNKMKDRNTYILESYPSGDEIDTAINVQKIVNREYNLKDLQLAIRFFPKNSLEPLQIDFLSNKISTVSKGQHKLHVLNILIESPNGNTVFFDPYNKCQMRLSVEIPEIFHCTLGTHWKWLQISIIANNQQSATYSIDLGDRLGNRNPNYYNIQEKSFE